MASSGHFREKLSTRGKAGRSPPGKQSNKENLAPKTWRATRRFAGPPRPPYLANNLPLCQLAPFPATALSLSGLSLVRRTSCPFAGLDSPCIAKIAHVCDLARFGRAKKTAARLRPGETQDALIVLDSRAQLNHIHERFLRASSLYSTKRGRPLVETPCPVGQGALPSRRKRAKAAAMPSLSAPPRKASEVGERWLNAFWQYLSSGSNATRGTARTDGRLLALPRKRYFAFRLAMVSASPNSGPAPFITAKRTRSGSATTLPASSCTP